METPLIEFRNVTKRFNGKTVLDNINLSIYENQVTTIIGKSGTGKSVLLKHIIGLLKPDEGTILFQGKPVNKMKKAEWEGHRRKVAYLFQNNALLDSMTVLDNVAFPLRQTTNLSKAEIEKRAMKRIDDLELEEAVNKFPSELSGGMQKRVALARALVTDPRIVLFDEPTTGQDPIRKNMILSMIIHYRKKYGFTAVMISHDIPDVFFISDRVIILWEGGVGFEGPYEEALKQNVPMIDEFLRSLDGFQDQLTGLLSREAFKMHYSAMLGAAVTETKYSAALFGVRLNILYEALGAQAAVAVLKALGEYANRYFSSIGGFSARHSRDEILTIFPHKNLAEARRLVEGFSRELENGVVDHIRNIAWKSSDATCFDIYIRAGVIEISPEDSIEEIIEKGRAKQEIISTHRCDLGGDVQ